MIKYMLSIVLACCSHLVFAAQSHGILIHQPNCKACKNLLGDPDVIQEGDQFQIKITRSSGELVTLILDGFDIAVKHKKSDLVKLIKSGMIDHVGATPTVIFLDDSKNEVGRVVGYNVDFHKDLTKMYDKI